jgi:hypothetical protein
MPEGEHMKVLGVCFVVHQVSDAAEENTTDTRCSGAFVLGTDTRLFSKQRNGFPEICANGSRR